MVTIALQGDFGKPRPALVIQSDLFPSHRVGAVIGRLNRQEIQQVDRALAVFMGLI